jgi:aminocarboxymuconate-semialdehyde decarboxylase
MAQEAQSSRRTFVGALGVGVAAGAFGGPNEVAGQPALPLKIVDFHNHYMGPSWTLTNLAGLPGAARAA